MTENVIQTVAFHEAGHAVACIIMSRAFDSVLATIEGGRCSWKSDQLRSWAAADSFPRKPVEVEIVVTYAGVTAERKLTGRHTPLGDDHDQDRATLLASKICGDMASVEKLINRLYKRSEKLWTKKAWKAVEAVAAVLMEGGELHYEEVKSIVTPRLQGVKKPF